MVSLFLENIENALPNFAEPCRIADYLGFIVRFFPVMIKNIFKKYLRKIWKKTIRPSNFCS